MRKAFALIFMVFVFTQCDHDAKEDCSVPATVRNLTGLDGCGWVFELKDGTRLEPFFGIPRCGFADTTGRTSEDALANFEFADGKMVFISYEIMEDLGSYCMVGPIAKITCITEPSLFISGE